MRASLIAAILVLSASLSPARAEPFTVIAFGDMPYGEPSEVYPPFEVLLAEINARQPDIVFHVGDTKAGKVPCDDKILDEQRAFLGTLSAPTLYTPGDNEWTDCNDDSVKRRFDTRDRLDYIRRTYFANPGQSFGQRKLPVTSQGGKFPENVRLQIQNVGIVTVHVVGADNNRDKDKDEYRNRNDAGVAWLRAGFETYADTEAMIVVIHANPFRKGFKKNKETWKKKSGFRKFGRALRDATAEYGKPVLLVHGDTHEFRVRRMMPDRAPDLCVLEVFGHEDMHAVEVVVDPSQSRPFTIAPVANPALDSLPPSADPVPQCS